MAENPTVEMKTNKGTMKLELFQTDAPNTVASFMSLINKGFYNGLTFHRVISDFVIQGGCPNGVGNGHPGYSIDCEVGPGKPKHQRGSLSMAHAGPNTGGSQFFICHSPQGHLDNKHTVFGKVVEGLDVVDAIRQGDKMEEVKVLSGTAPEPKVRVRA